MRVQTIQAYARGWKERLVIQKILKRRRAFWGAVVWTFRAMRFKRDRLAAFTLQCTVRDPLQRDRRRGKQFDSVARTCRRVLEATRSKALEDILLPPSIGLGPGDRLWAPCRSDCVGSHAQSSSGGVGRRLS